MLLLQLAAVGLLRRAGALAPLTARVPSRSTARRAATGGDGGGGEKPVRLNKCLLSLSRRAADAAIAEGRVRVDGAVADGRTPIARGSVVDLDGVVQAWDAKEDAKAAPGTSDAFYYLKYWKPRGVTCTTDPHDGTNVVAAGGFGNLGQRVFTVGRLDKASTGLLLLTSDGRCVDALLRPRQKKEKRYVVELHTPPTDEDIAALAAGVVITTDRQSGPPLTAPTRPCEVRRVNPRAPTALEFILTEGRNRQIRRMCTERGLDVRRLHRTHFAGIGLEGIRKGEWAHLDERERALIDTALRNNSDP